MKFAHLGHKTDALRKSLSKEMVTIASPIINPKGPRRKGHVPGDLDVRTFSVERLSWEQVGNS